MTKSRLLEADLVAASAGFLPVAATPPVELTIDRLFDAPALSGPAIRGVQISPNGARVTYLRGSPGDNDRLDLWEHDLRTGRARILVDATALIPGNEPLSEEEVNRRERTRTAALSGILEYSLAASGDALLFPLAGQIYYCDLAGSTRSAVIRVTDGNGSATDATLSRAAGTWLSSATMIFMPAIWHRAESRH